ncbi:hypothetical protein NW10_18880 [Salmonella enterica subsp. enterica serovar Weslaco]|nr:hypothetical protein NW10_18880 [Salmonella enterica subsp. enterica serovar Weslaco]
MSGGGQYSFRLFSSGAELQRTWNREDAAEWADVYTKIFPAYQLLIESYTKAKEVVKNNELMDSQRA